MFQVIEFEESSGGGVAVVRGDWMTPRKKKTFWPPYKYSSQYNRSLSEGQQPDVNKWKLFGVKRIFYNTDDLQKAKDKCKEAEDNSEVQTDCGGTVRQRFNTNTTEKLQKFKATLPETPTISKKVSRQNISSSDESEGSHEKLSKKRKRFKTSPASLSSQRKIDSDEDSGSDDTDYTHSQSLLSCVQATYGSPNANKDSSYKECLTSTPSTSGHRYSNNEWVTGNDVIARHLAKINNVLVELRDNQQVIMKHLCLTNDGENCNGLIIKNLELPCTSVQDIEALENWLSLSDENVQSLETFMAYRGGKSVRQIVKRICERLFENKVCPECNWTGKGGKKALKTLKFVEIIQRSVRRNRYTTDATDWDINLAVTNWFKYSKDRDGGRNRRRQNQPQEQQPQGAQ